MCILEIWGYTFYNGGVDEMKKIILVVLLISVFGCVAEAKEGVEEINMTGQVIMKVDSNKAFVDTLETYIDYNDNAITPIVDNDVVFIPLRFVAQNIDSKVLWNKKDNSITIYKDNRDIQIWDNSTTVLVSGIEKLLKYQPRIIKNRIYMEVNDFANLLKCTVFINGEFIIFDKSGDAEKFPTVSILEEMYCEYPNTGRNLYPICKPLSTTGSGLVSQIGFMDKHGKMVIEPVHTIVENQSKYFTQGLFCTSKEIINEKGEVITSGDYFYGDSFCNGLAVVYYYDIKGNEEDDEISAVINKDGKEVLRDIDFTFEKGAGKKVDQCGKKFVLKYGMDKLNEVAKIHFKNTEKILDLINK